MRSPLAYSPRPGPLSHSSAGAASVYLGSLVVCAFAYSNPIVLAGTGAAVVVAGVLADAGPALRLAGRWALALGILVAAVNVIASQRGDTILVRGFGLPVIGQIDISLEALVEGAVLALRIGVVFAAGAVYSACVDPDRVMRMIRPLAPHSALTATLITRLVPLAAADQARLREASALRGPGAAAVGRVELARRLLAGSLDRAVDIAATLELRGYARGVPRRSSRRRSSRHSWRFAAAGVTIAAVAIAVRLAGAGGFEPYPTVSITTEGATLALAAALPLLAAAPYIGIPRHPTRGRNG
jgi:energy-coupling factor transport system permease protein